MNSNDYDNLIMFNRTRTIKTTNRMINQFLIQKSISKPKVLTQTLDPETVTGELAAHDARTTFNSLKE
uniref:Uncharacterized protein n=1 Tax=Helianthus annuus TaxID=4232 RepID=A0A251UWJ2_HELAN